MKVSEEVGSGPRLFTKIDHCHLNTLYNVWWFSKKNLATLYVGYKLRHNITTQRY